MNSRLQISTRKMSLSDVALNTIRSKAKKLERFYDRIIACKVMVEAPHRHKNHGVEYNVSIDIAVPGSDINVKHERHEDVYVAIRDAFESAQRQLKSYNRKRKEKKSRTLNLLAEQSAEAEVRRQMETALKSSATEIGL